MSGVIQNSGLCQESELHSHVSQRDSWLEVSVLFRHRQVVGTNGIRSQNLPSEVDSAVGAYAYQDRAERDDSTPHQFLSREPFFEEHHADYRGKHDARFA